MIDPGRRAYRSVSTAWREAMDRADEKARYDARNTVDGVLYRIEIIDDFHPSVRRVPYNRMDFWGMYGTLGK